MGDIALMTALCRGLAKLVVFRCMHSTATHALRWPTQISKSQDSPRAIEPSAESTTPTELRYLCRYLWPHNKAFHNVRSKFAALLHGGRERKRKNDAKRRQDAIVYHYLFFALVGFCHNYGSQLRLTLCSDLSF